MVAKPSLNVEALERGLASHPDKFFVSKIIYDAINGVSIGYDGPRKFREHDNWPSAYKYKDAVTASIEKDVSMGRKAGPFDHPPFTNFVGSPMGAFQKKKRSDKYRIIHDLSWPPGHSVNDFIPAEDFHLQYISVDTVTDHIKRCGPGTLLAKLDLADAFKHIMVRKEDWELLGTVWYKPDQYGNLVKQYYIDLVLPFGLRSSPKLFDNFVVALEYIMLQTGVTHVFHYLDDFITFGETVDECQGNLDMMLETCKTVGFDVNPEKVVDATPVLEFLGFIIDTNKMEIRISQERLDDITDELQRWKVKTCCTKRELLSLIGKLTFISKVVRSSRTFVRRMIELSKRVRFLHYKIKLNDGFKCDLNWWLHYLPQWNGVTLFYDEMWTSNIDLHLFTDASNRAIGCYFQGSWLYLEFVGSLFYAANMSINWRELFAIIMAAATWGSHLSQKRVLFHCDNLSVVHILQSGTSKCTEMMKLVRTLFYVCAQHQFECNAIYLSTHENEVADALSRVDLRRFRKLVPEADIEMTEPCDMSNFNQFLI